MGLADIVRKERRGRPARSNVAEKYVYTLHDRSIATPFVINDELAEKAETYRRIEGDYAKARCLFEWFMRSIKYKDVKYYKNAVQVLESGCGICADEAALYITMARYSGLEASFVEVNKDDSKKRVRHACAAVKLNNKWVLVDPAYEEFDIKHRKYRIISDDAVRKYFDLWSGKT